MRSTSRCSQTVALLGVLALLCGSADAQPAVSFEEIGNLYLQTFTQEDYDAHMQNWDIAQAPDGLIYVANGDGVLEYDGVSWRLIPISNHSVARSLTINPDGRVFVGAVGELGFLDPDSTGALRYVSLIDHLPPEEREFADVWRTEKTSKGVYFQTRYRLFRWNGREMKVWSAEYRINQIFVLEGSLYLHQRDRGLMRMENDALVMAPNGDHFRNDRPYSLISWDESTYLAVTARDGLYRCPLSQNEGAGCSRFAPDATDMLIELVPYHATRLPQGLLAIATLRGGLVLLDRDGRLLRILNEASGLPADMVLFLFLDPQDGLWLGLNGGLARIETRTALSFWDKTAGLKGAVLDVTRHRGQIYAATALGVFRLTQSSEDETSTFQAIPPVLTQCWSLLSTPQGLLAGCREGLYNFDLKQYLLVSNHILKVVRGQRDPESLYLGLLGGFVRMRLSSDQESDAEPIASIEAQVNAIVEDPEGQLWLGTEQNGVFRIEPSALDGREAGEKVGEGSITRFGSAEGLPEGRIDPILIDGRMVAFAVRGGGLWRPEPASDPIRFVPETAFDKFLPRGSESVSGLGEDDQGRVWIAAGFDSGVAQPTADGRYTWSPTELRRIPSRDISQVHPETGGPLWLSGSQGLLRYDPSQLIASSASYPASIRRVTTAAGTVLSDGRSGDRPVELLYRDNSLRFAFAAPHHSAPEFTRYRVRLDGRGRAATGDGWSPWVDETYKEYTSLWEGRYAFRVQARDFYGKVSDETSFSFRILPPWYRSWWAYTLYALAIVGMIAAYRRSHREQLLRAQAVNRRLREVDRLKDEFLANTSHELRTPLYGMTGLAESLIEGAAGEMSEDAKANLEMIVGSGQRLGHLVNDILDFSKLRHKSLELSLGPVELHALIDVVVTLSASLVGSKNLRLVNATKPDLPPASADENRLQQILYNLIGNAIKFTEVGIVEVSAESQGDRLVVRVADTGIGIPEETQERIFDAFEQADASIEREYGGTGLGLALTRQLVELHGGTIDVESTPGQGSTFSFSLPVADAAESAQPQTAEPDDDAYSLTFEPDPSSIAIPAPDVHSSNGGPRVLVVDDEPVNLQVVRNYLSMEDFDLTLASSGEQAMSLLEKEEFDLVLLDVMMPKISGYEVCRNLRENHSISDLPVIFLTAKTQDSDVVAGMALGANDYLTKPISKERLLARVRPHLELLQAHRHLEDRVEEKIAEVKVLSGLLPICANCKKIRDDEGYWNHLETFIGQHSEASFSHGICPSCLEGYLTKHPELRPNRSS